MEPIEPPAFVSEPRTIPITRDHFGFINIEAWLNIIRSYQAKYPHHRVHLIYRGEEIRNRMYLFKMARPIDKEGFQCYVSADDQDLGDTTKLYRLLMEGAGPNPHPFITQEVNRVLDLF